jgi:hypothetical protein
MYFLRSPFLEKLFLQQVFFEEKINFYIFTFILASTYASFAQATFFKRLKTNQLLAYD